METLADYGTVSYFGVQTFTTGIYRAWFSLGDRIAAAQLAAALLAFVILLLVIEHALARPFPLPQHERPPSPLAVIVCRAGAAGWPRERARYRWVSASCCRRTFCCVWR
jgi:ABC-type Fe3+ transport system permease subunit